jgi:hypothetical protein
MKPGIAKAGVGGAIGGVVALLLAFAFIGVVGSCLITIGIWPGQLKLLAPVICSDEQPDAFVVSDTYSPQPGETVTNFSLYCMGERGDATDHGFAKPFLMISVVNGVAIFALLTLIGLLIGAGRRRRRHAADPDRVIGAPPTSQSGPPGPPGGSTAGPFVN